MWAADARPSPAAAAPAPPPRPPGFERLPVPGAQDGPALEQALLERAAAGGAVAALWECRPALVVPATYRRFERFEALSARFAAQGWPVSVRRSGGGLVPQGPGMLNLSLAWRTPERMADAMEPVYAGLCGLLQDAFAAFRLQAQPQAVEGSFCDGRYNLALGGRKVVGTAQCWKRVDARHHAVLAHACVLVETALPRLLERANAFEAQLGNDRQYRADALANLVPATGRRPADAQGRALDVPALAERLAQALAVQPPWC